MSLLLLPSAALTQDPWNSPRSLSLATRATERRDSQLSDPELTDYRARGRGFITFLAQLGEGFPEPPVVVKADEIATEIFWRAPSFSKQRVVGMRDTLLLPGDIGYYRDRYGIIQNNFPDLIRLGDGQDVRDVPHPLSARGLTLYDFAIRDSLSVRLADRTIDVYELLVRPKDDRQPRVIGSIFVARDDAAVVRMALTFTRASQRDARNESLSVMLENGLIEGRFWLPRRQELELIRVSTWLDYPARSIIRARWEVCCYATNVGLDPAFFAGPEIVALPPEQLAQHRFEGRVLDSLPPDVRALDDPEVQRIRADAEELVRAHALARTRGSALSARRISDFLRVNRVEGLAAGLGLSTGIAPGVLVSGNGRYGFSDRRFKGKVVLDVQRPGTGLQLVLEDGHREAGDVLERSLVMNTLAAPLTGSDHSDPFGIRAASIGLDLRQRLGVRWRLEGAVEQHRALDVNATALWGNYQPAIAADSMDVVRASLFAQRSQQEGPFGMQLRWNGELRGGTWSAQGNGRAGDVTLDHVSRAGFLRVAGSLAATRPYGRSRLLLATNLAAVTSAERVPEQYLIRFGGAITAPGYDYHSLAGSVGVSQRIEWQTPMPFVAIPLGRYGRSPATATFAPYLNVAAVGRPGLGDASGTSASGIFPSAGVATIFFFEFVRLDVARGLRNGRWTLSLDVMREFWGIL